MQIKSTRVRRTPTSARDAPKLGEVPYAEVDVELEVELEGVEAEGVVYIYKSMQAMKEINFFPASRYVHVLKR